VLCYWRVDSVMNYFQLIIYIYFISHEIRTFYSYSKYIKYSLNTYTDKLIERRQCVVYGKFQIARTPRRHAVQKSEILLVVRAYFEHAAFSLHLTWMYQRIAVVQPGTKCVMKMQRVQNTLAHETARQGQFDHIKPVLKECNWLPIENRVTGNRTQHQQPTTPRHDRAL